MGTYKVEKEVLVPEDEWLPARLKSVVEKSVEFTLKRDDPRSGKKKGDKSTFDKIVWTFELTGEDYEDEVVYGECKPELTSHPNNRFRLWVEALMQGSLSLGDEIDPEDLVGLECMVLVKHRVDGERIFVEVSQVATIDDEDVPF